MTKLNRMDELPAAVLSMLLDGNNESLKVLRTQLNMAEKVETENTGTGFYINFIIPAEAPVLPIKEPLRIGDVVATLDGLKNGAGFVLFVQDGKIKTLEGYSYEEPWPKTISNYTLSYGDSGGRDLSGLMKERTT